MNNDVRFLLGPLLGLMMAAFAALVGWGSPSSPMVQGVSSLLLVGPAIFFAATGSTFAITYILTIWCIAPEVRRLLDWSGNTYTSVTLISLAPSLATAGLIVPVVSGLTRIKGTLRIAIVMIASALLYGLAIGAVEAGGAASAAEFVSWAMPLLILPYIATRPTDRAERVDWLRASVFLGVLVSLYTWIQFIYAPPWDMSWLILSGMTSTMGAPLPMQFRAFGPLNSTGTAGFFFPFLIGAIWAVPQLRGAVGAISALTLASALAITQVRSGWLILIGMLFAGVIVRGKGPKWRRILALLLGLCVLAVLIPMLPGGEQVQQRAATFGDLDNDSSYGARAATSRALIGQIATNAVGTGFGASSAAKVAGTSSQANGIDNGYLAIFLYLGWGGATLFFGGLMMLGKLALSTNSIKTNIRSKIAIDNDLRPLAIAALAGCFVGTLAISVFAGVTAVLLWFLFGVMISRPQQQLRRTRY